MAGSVFGSSEVNYESWRAVKYLRGHDSDVQDLAWSKDNQYLASCGVDGFVIVWDGSTFGKKKKKISTTLFRLHTLLFKSKLKK